MPGALGTILIQQNGERKLMAAFFLPKSRYESKLIFIFASSKVIINIINNKQKNIMAYVIGEDCIACGTCIDECPVGAISEGERYSIDPDACTECGTCAGVCPSEAISLPE